MQINLASLNISYSLVRGGVTTEETYFLTNNAKVPFYNCQIGYQAT